MDVPKSFPRRPVGLAETRCFPSDLLCIVEYYSAFKAPTGERARGGEGRRRKKKSPAELRQMKSQLGAAGGRRAAADSFLRLRPGHTQITRPHCVTARSTSAVAPWDLSPRRPLSSPPTPFGWATGRPREAFSRIMCRLWRHRRRRPRRLCRRDPIRDRATVLTIITEKRRVRERKNDTTPGQERKEGGSEKEWVCALLWQGVKRADTWSLNLDAIHSGYSAEEPPENVHSRSRSRRR